MAGPAAEGLREPLICQALAEYCHGHYSKGAGRVAPPCAEALEAAVAEAPSRVPQRHISDPSDYLCPNFDCERPGDMRRLSTPSTFRKHFLRLAGPSSREVSKGVLDFILDVAFDVQEHHERLAQRPRRTGSEEALRALDTHVEEAATHGRRRQSSDVATVLVILKSFVGGTLLVMPAEFLKAGVLSGSLLFWTVGILELWCMLKLLETHQDRGGSFGELAGQALGRVGAAAVDVSIVLCQVGFISTEMIYVARNGSSAVQRLTARFPELSGRLRGLDVVAVLTWAQLLFVVPVAWYRDLAALTAFNFVGNLLVLGTLLVLSVMTVGGLAEQGTAEEIQLGCSLQEALAFLGFSTFTFEGINMVIPMYTAHRDKRSFNRLLGKTILGIITLFSVFGLANVLLYGRKLEPILTLNLPQNSEVVGWIPLAFALASLVAVPLMAFPTFEILEGFARRGCGSTLVGSHFRVNVFRAVLMSGCAILAHVGGAHLGDFLSLVGAWGCVPLAFVYPSVIHLRLMARSSLQVLGDVVCLAVGLGITVFCTASILWPDSG
mmetsp:Transcript_77242/g.213630  ORF Transcript_77242/g.213630 Transcript_77242/m.213630 type:complete len:551 (-) Transcript_77242:76-1728(-)